MSKSKQINIGKCTKISFSTEQPKTQDKEGYEALEWHKLNGAIGPVKPITKTERVTVMKKSKLNAVAKLRMLVKGLYSAGNHSVAERVNECTICVDSEVRELKQQNARLIEALEQTVYLFDGDNLHGYQEDHVDAVKAVLNAIKGSK